MKKTLLLLLFLVATQVKATHVQINFTAGFNIGIGNPFDMNPSMGDSTTDASINSIFSAYGVNQCYNNFSDTSPVIFAIYEGSDINGFLSSLSGNPDVVQAISCPFPYIYADRLYLELYDIANGNPVGFAGTVVVTTNADLNAIFANYSVTEMQQAFPNSVALFRVFEIRFNGDINALLQALQGNTAIEYTENISVPMLLGTNAVTKMKPVVYPNPFSDEIQIQADTPPAGYALYDSSGKTLLETSCYEAFTKKAGNLPTGCYFLKLKSQDGAIFTQKLIKK